MDLAIRLGAFIIAIACFAGPAEAAVLPIGGAYGNEAGCRFYLLGEPDAEMIVLTGDTVSSFTAGCDFTSMISQVDDVFTIQAVCSGEGQNHPGMDQVIVTRRGDGGFLVAIEGGAEWGPLLECPGVADLLSPGVRT
jgi:hypothetical protein